MDLQGDSVNIRPRSRLHQKSMTHISLARDRPPVEGLKKFAFNYKNSVGKLQLDKFRYDKRPLTDPRFRRERTTSPKKSLHSQSDCYFTTTAKDQRPVSQSAPTFS